MWTKKYWAGNFNNSSFRVKVLALFGAIILLPILDASTETSSHITSTISEYVNAGSNFPPSHHQKQEQQEYRHQRQQQQKEKLESFMTTMAVTLPTTTVKAAIVTDVVDEKIQPLKRIIEISTPASIVTKTTATRIVEIIAAAVAAPASSAATISEIKGLQILAATDIRTNNTSNSSSSGKLRASTVSSLYPFDFSLSKSHWTKNEDLSAKHKNLQSHSYQNKHHHEHHWGPFFEEPNLNSTTEGTLYVAAHQFTEATLNCRVGMLRDKTVMWVRRTADKVSLLTVGNITYSGDPRVRVKFQYPNNWRLIINPVQKDDASLYICQVSTHPPRVFATNLTVLDPPARIVDEQEHEIHDRYYKSGSRVELMCQISRNFVATLKKVLAKQNLVDSNLMNSTQFDERVNQLIQWQKDGANLPVKTLCNFSSNSEWYNNRITLDHANFSDSGNYSCSFAKIYETSVNVQILTGELPAAVQHNSQGSLICGPTKTLFNIFMFLHIMLYISPFLLLLTKYNFIERITNKK